MKTIDAALYKKSGNVMNRHYFCIDQSGQK